MKTTGVNRRGEVIEFQIKNGVLKCPSKELISINIPEGVREVNCQDNQLVDLIVPESVTILKCSANRLTKLILPQTVESVKCSWNRLTELNLPENVQHVDGWNNNFVNSESIFIRGGFLSVIFFQHGNFYYRNYCGKSPEEFKEICLYYELYDVIEYFIKCGKIPPND